MYNDGKRFGGRPYPGSNRQQEAYEFKHRFFEGKKLNPLWVGSEAKKFSEHLANGKDGLSTSGLRNFYNEFLRIKNIPATQADEKIVLVKLLAAKASYKNTTAKIPGDFVKFMNSLIAEIGDDLDMFEKSCYIMEALVGFNPRNK